MYIYSSNPTFYWCVIIDRDVENVFHVFIYTIYLYISLPPLISFKIRPFIFFSSFISQILEFSLLTFPISAIPCEMSRLSRGEAYLVSCCTRTLLCIVFLISIPSTHHVGIRLSPFTSFIFFLVTYLSLSKIYVYLIQLFFLFHPRNPPIVV